uniref:Uncharacterized protein n=1 Tax=Leptobrachium leishanense TaxID=445787 RepID=A0A8C5MAI3_9ANUR
MLGGTHGSPDPEFCAGFFLKMEANHAGKHHSAEKYTWEKRGGSKIQGSISGDKIMSVPHRIHSATKKPLHVLKKTTTTKKPSTRLASVSAGLSGIINIVDTADREGSATAENTYANSGTYAYAFTNEPGKRIPKAGAFAEAGVGRARAEFSVFEADAKGPNASASAEASLVGVNAIARAELASVSASAGPFSVTIGLGVDTGISAGVDGVEAKILGIGFCVGPSTCLSILGSKIACVIQ